MFKCHNLAKLPGISHGFFGREGGVSTGLYSSLNCGFGSGDDLEIVEKNRDIVAKAVGLASNKQLCTAFQVHSAIAVVLQKPWEWRDAPQADALVTNVPGLALGALAADCLPILFADGKARVIGAAHSGWKGAFTGVIEATIAAMESLGARRADIVASIGPGIAQDSYEVGPEFIERFLQQAATHSRYFKASPRAGHHFFDLKAYAHDRLQAAGAGVINVLAHDTCLQENVFFSYRRATLRGEDAYGRQISAITLD